MVQVHEPDIYFDFVSIGFSYFGFIYFRRKRL